MKKLKKIMNLKIKNEIKKYKKNKKNKKSNPIKKKQK